MPSRLEQFLIWKQYFLTWKECLLESLLDRYLCCFLSCCFLAASWWLFMLFLSCCSKRTIFHASWSLFMLIVIYVAPFLLLLDRYLCCSFLAASWSLFMLCSRFHHLTVLPNVPNSTFQIPPCYSTELVFKSKFKSILFKVIKPVFIEL